MKELLKRYYNVRLRIYSKKLYDQRSALIAAQYALEDMLSNLKRMSENISERYALDYLKDEVEYLEST